MSSIPILPALAAIAKSLAVRHPTSNIPAGPTNRPRSGLVGNPGAISSTGTY